MKNEKVKEIKDSIQRKINRAEKGKDDFVDCVSVDVLKIYLTLINELESENEELTKAVVDNLDAYRDGFNEGANLGGRVENKWREENQQLKDRIAELEKENDELKVDLKNSVDMQKQILDGFKTATKEVEENLVREIPNLLKQFAEKLKEKFNRQEERFATDVTRFENDLDKVKEGDLPTAKYLIGKATGQATMAEKAQYYIDETLNEFIKR